MFCSDYLLRIIQQATAALAVPLGLRRAGRHAELNDCLAAYTDRLGPPLEA